MSKDLATGKRFQYVAPQSLRSDVLRGCHEDAGHQGQLRTMHLVKQRFYWANMERDVAHPCEVLHQVCVMSKTPEPDGRAPLENVKTTAPLELVCIDFWTAEEEAKGRAMNVFVVTDHYTKLSHAFCCSDQTANVAQKLWDFFFFFFFASTAFLSAFTLTRVETTGFAPFLPRVWPRASVRQCFSLKRIQAESRHQARVYNRQVKGGQIVCGDRVLLANKGERGRKKLADKWEKLSLCDEWSGRY